MKQGLLIGVAYILHLSQADAQRLQDVALAAMGQPGGWQSLVRLLADRLTPGGHLEVDDLELARIDRYITHYGGGGYQDALKGVRRAAWAAGWQK